MIEEFERWFLDIAPVLRERGHSIEWQDAGHGIGKPSAYAQLETPVQIARATIWSSGECELEALDVASGAQLVNEHHVFKDVTRMREALDTFIQQIEAASRSS